MGAGASGRNTTIIRSNYLTAEGARFYEESVKIYESLSQDLDFNMLFSQHGHLTLAHSDRSLNSMM
jgi:sarcosine oxidase subunit beta